mmetsp:Transcript_31808/g.64761  ORF Transcript_31808/g.64761 Transcript_31808/m.64761 type:complete len:94 (+) Transcript_31808:886-1167(+)
MEITIHTTSENMDGPARDAKEGWEEEYYQYLAEKEAAGRSEAGKEEEVSGSTSSGEGYGSEEHWAAQYAAYCAEKEKRLDEEEKRKKGREHQM